jgi:hypothetical protein|nr:MAG TPA: hypothetical protein [Caudoviricetes sp.]DAR55583.1 MAG TPA: hypothetical protein [Bacteriophage sp.]
MLYYLGKEGNAFKKEECKKYKTKDGALKAMAKAEGTCVWDAEGNLINGNSEEGTEPEQQSEQEAEPEAGTEPEQQSEQEAEPEAETEPGQQSEQEEEPEPEAETEPETETESEQQSEPEESTEPKVIIPQGKMKVTVICDGSLNIHRTPEWGESNICGRAIRGQTYYVKEIHMVDGRKMVRTVGDLYLSGESEFVQFEQL